MSLEETRAGGAKRRERKTEQGAGESRTNTECTNRSYAIKDFKATEFLAVERILAGLIKEKHFDFTWQEKPILSPSLHQKGEEHEAWPITKSMWPKMERRARAGHWSARGTGKGR